MAQAVRAIFSVANFSPIFLTSARAVIAACLGAALLAALRQRWPERRDLPPLSLVALGVAGGFPLLTALALRQISAAHSIVFIGLLPLATALFGALRGDERPKLAFWLFSSASAVKVAAFALAGRSEGAATGDLLMFATVVVCGLSYAEGAALSRRRGGWQVISWALLLSLPLMTPLALLSLPGSWGGIGLPAWLGLGYVSVFSMLIGFVFWHRGLALGGVAGVSQLQLLQPFFGFVLATALLCKPISMALLWSATGVIGCVAGVRRFA